MCLESFCDEIISYPEIVVDNVHFWTKTESLQGFYSKIKSKLVLVIPLILLLKVLYKINKIENEQQNAFILPLIFIIIN